MPEYTNTVSLGGKTGKILAIIIVAGLIGFFGYAKITGKSLHIKSGTINGTNLKVTQYFDNVDTVEGKGTTAIASGRHYYVVMGGTIAIDLAPVIYSVNSHYPQDHFITGNPDDIKPNARITAVVRESSSQDPIPGFTIDHWYEVLPVSPFHISIQNP